MNALKTYFLGRLLREKVMLALLVALGALMWFSNFSRRAARDWRAQHAVTVELAEQKQWLGNRAAIEAGALQAVKNFDPAKTLDDTRLVGDLSALARENGLKLTNDTPRTERSGSFAIHTVQITIQRAEWEPLKRFYLALARRSPYLGLEQLALAADRTNPAQLNASLRVSSVEIVR